MKTIFWLILGILLLITLLVWYRSLDNNFQAIISTESKVEPPAFHLPVFPIYLQNDPRWKDNKIGGSQETLGAVGCTVCCVSMALAHHGIHWLPNQLNELLKTHDGYTQQGWLKWYTLSKITDNQITFYIPNKPSLAVIDAALNAGEPVVAKILLYDVVYHWVLIVGKAGKEYLVKDPLGDGQSLDKLSKFKSKIYAIRVVKKNG